MFLKEKTDAIVLAHYDYGEGDRRIILLTEEFGKISAIANGERKPLSKLRAGLSLFSWSEVELIFGRRSPIITMARPKNVFVNLSQDWRKFIIAEKMTQDINVLIPWESPESDSWFLTLGGLNALNLIKDHYQRLYYYFLWTILISSGYQIDLNNCIRCGQKLTEESYLVAEESIVCADCLGLEDLSEKVSPNTIKILRLIAQKEKGILRRIQTSENDRDNLEKISRFFLASTCS
jgi:DNA repair protein RecO (recombination protein O)